jgi:hypothetical protein
LTERYYVRFDFQPTALPPDPICLFGLTGRDVEAAILREFDRPFRWTLSKTG